MVVRIAFQPGVCVMVYRGQWRGKVGWVTGVTVEFVRIALNILVEFIRIALNIGE